MNLEVLYQFNEKYAPFAGVSITSLFENNRIAESIRVHILGEGLSESSIKTFEEVAEKYHRSIVFVKADMLIRKMQELNMPTYRGSYAANMRLFLPEVLDKGIDRLLYLDADTVVDGTLGELWNTNMLDYPLAMALDSLGACHGKDIGLEKTDYYFNSGVILFQMNKWRELQLSEKIIYHIKYTRAHYPSPDQDLLNVVCKNNVFCLHAKFNFQPIHLAFSIKEYYRYYGKSNYYSREEIEEASESIVIYHFFRFIGEFPWNINNMHPDNAIFDKYLHLSAWKDYEKKSENLKGMIKIEKNLYQILPKGLFIVIFRFAHQWFLWRANQASLKLKIDKEM